MVLLGENELRIYGERFLCQLCRTAKGIIERRFNRYDIFKELGITVFLEAGIRQATDEIVQYLYLRCDFIRTIETSEEIHLTMVGLAECERICK
jgi:hypothetical protein